MVDVHQLEIDKKAAKMSESKPGSAAYLGCYRKAVKAIEEGLNEESNRITELRQRNGVSNSCLLASNNSMCRNLSIRSEATKFH